MPQEGVEVPFHPPPEAAPSESLPSPEGNQEVSARKRAKNAVVEGFGFIKSKYDTGFFDAGDKADAKKDAEKVLDQVGRNNLDSGGLKAFFNSLSVIGGETDEVRKTAAENMRVKVGDRMLTLDEWSAELEAAQKPVDGKPPDPERVKELENGVFAYSFPKTTEENPESASVPKGKSPEDRIIIEQLSLLEGIIEKQSGGRPTEKQQQLIGALRLAKEAKGEAGVLIKEGALRGLKQSGIFGLENTIENLSEEVPIARDKLFDHLKGQGWSEGDINGFIEVVKTGNVEGMIREGKFPKAEGLDRLFFGRELKDEQLERLLDPEKKKKWPRNALLLALLFSAIVPVTLVQESTKAR